MAGEWIKVEASTPNKPEILRAARQLGADPDLVLGKLLKLWSWFDLNTVDGHVDGVVAHDIDRIVGMDGFAAALMSVGWLECDDKAENVTLPNFNRHNGETAKKRAVKNKRQARWRQSKDAGVDGTVVDLVDGAASTAASTREEKRRNTPVGADSPPNVDAALFAEAKIIFGQSIGGTINKAIGLKGKGWVVDIIDKCRGKDPEAAKAYLHRALNGKSRERGFQA